MAEEIGNTTIELEESQAAARGNDVPVLDWVFPEAAAGTRVLLVHGATLGRAETCSVRLDGEGVSRQHAEILREGPALTLRDVGSTNGTFLDGRRVVHAAVRDGAVLRIGGWVGLFGWARRDEAHAASGLSLIAPGFWAGDAVLRAIEPARRAAKSELPLLLVGETGTGKEVAARAMHEWSERSGRFVAVNCAALPHELFEGELFGHRRGAFTGATRDNVGYFRSAHRGTLLLDEITELPLALQAKLLRVVQERAVTPLGEAEPLPVDVRLLAASQKPLVQAVAAGEFREDLFMRLKGVQVELPALRARRTDVPPLFAKFLADGTKAQPQVDARVIEALCLYDWPGNVRELELLSRSLVAVYGGEPLLKLRHLPPELLEQRSGGEEASPSPALDRAASDLARLAAKLRENGANVSRACADLGISRQRAYRLLAGRSVSEFLAKHR